MIRFPNAKINLGLNIVRKRTDGYHDLETIFYPIPLKDALEILPDPSPNASGIPRLTVSGMSVEGSPEDNICVKAWQLLKTDFPQLPSVQIFLHKVIPMGAGLGGGSSDGACALAMLNEIYSLGLTKEVLSRYALMLGSDCPFFIHNQPCFAEGRGEILSPVPAVLQGYTLLLVNPGVHVSTAAAFGGIQPAEAECSLKDLILQPVESWKASIRNDFEKSIFPRFPEIDAIKDALYNSGAVYACMSGSGSSVYGIYRDILPERPLFPAYYNQHWFQL
jgi:4-diphosphocytidyl-2-C-methyl-D-erythritol kinase